MTDNEIIKALECCGDAKTECSSCPLYSLKCAYCVEMKSNNALDLIKRQKEEITKLSADVEPVKRGEWIRNGWNDYSCSCCNSRYIGHGALTWNFCPYCGAKRREA